MKPVIHWTGSKVWIAEYLQQFVLPNTRIVEPFAGGAALTFTAMPQSAWLNDRCAPLVNFYQQVQLGEAYSGLDACVTPGDYYRLRDEYNHTDIGQSPERHATLFYFLNCYAFNHLYRENAAGKFNVPFRLGKLSPGWPVNAIPPRWSVTCRDFRTVLYQTRDEASNFIFADPPYDGTFGYGGFTNNDQLDLAIALRQQKGRVVAMNAATESMLELYSNLGFHVTQVESAQAWHHSQRRRDSVREMLATNFEIIGCLPIVDASSSVHA